MRRCVLSLLPILAFLSTPSASTRANCIDYRDYFHIVSCLELANMTDRIALSDHYLYAAQSYPGGGDEHCALFASTARTRSRRGE